MTNSTVYQSMDAFLASVEKKAFIMAKMATHDDDIALDIVQDAMLKMVKNYAKKPAEEWPPLFYRIVSNRITDQHRKRGLGRLTQWFGFAQNDDEYTNDAVDQLSSEELHPEGNVVNQELRQTLLDALAQLPKRQQQAFTLRLWQGLSVSETATAMGISEGSVKTHLSRALSAMRSHMTEYRAA